MKEELQRVRNRLWDSSEARFGCVGSPGVCLGFIRSPPGCGDSPAPPWVFLTPLLEPGPAPVGLGRFLFLKQHKPHKGTLRAHPGQSHRGLGLPGSPKPPELPWEWSRSSREGSGLLKRICGCILGLVLKGKKNPKMSTKPLRGKWRLQEGLKDVHKLYFLLIFCAFFLGFGGFPPPLWSTIFPVKTKNPRC